ncbi:DUF6197 family protein [Brucella sp. 2716]|uniref:DUF6197 family protein n=1 Tax=Brucella sp. 2716 TaxID=2975052 RepID=UPI00217E584F|nr:hypothetical protein [Brucella sp. 2716]UWF59825.1 hypothetical protein NYO66_04755 [Brucella sp. 2716]
MNTAAVIPAECPAANPLVAVVLPPDAPVSTVLRAARDLISVPGRWTKWGYGFKEKPETLDDAFASRRLFCDLSEATCFCSWGALLAVMGVSNRVYFGEAFSVLKDTIRATTDFRGIPAFNDAPSTTHADVLRMFNRAIKKAEEEEKLATVH